ncbi:hypothetical protein [Acinetobacter sp. TAC-1]|uniref:hypothetical protein n=1 Tax=Acinetobacter sp. TAC-1 TaxID=3027470 RepID=UPI0023AAC03B|nr:hypothetical protein [Acinetobacter sp. TAC-1]WEE40979.1 hypothetical protein PYV58_07425 [Acinetobacter sp. TAC-1]
MNAVELVIKFIQRHGFEDTKKIIESIDLEMTHITCDGRMFMNENTRNLESHVVNQLSELVVIHELKRLVESWELVIVWRMPESWRDAYDGDVLGLEGARMYLEMFGNHELTGEELERFKQAIADVESVGGGV